MTAAGGAGTAQAASLVVLLLQKSFSLCWIVCLLYLDPRYYILHSTSAYSTSVSSVASCHCQDGWQRETSARRWRTAWSRWRRRSSVFTANIRAKLGSTSPTTSRPGTCPASPPTPATSASKFAPLRIHLMCINLASTINRAIKGFLSSHSTGKYNLRRKIWSKTCRECPLQHPSSSQLRVASITRQGGDRLARCRRCTFINDFLICWGHTAVCNYDCNRKILAPDIWTNWRFNLLPKYTLRKVELFKSVKPKPKGKAQSLLTCTWKQQR